MWWFRLPDQILYVEFSLLLFRSRKTRGQIFIQNSDLVHGQICQSKWLTSPTKFGDEQRDLGHNYSTKEMSAPLNSMVRQTPFIAFATPLASIVTSLSPPTISIFTVASNNCHSLVLVLPAGRSRGIPFYQGNRGRSPKVCHERRTV